MPRAKKTAPGKIRAHEKASRALELRLAGKSFDAIAAELGYANRSGAFHAVDGLLKARIAEATENADELRKLDLERLDAMALALWPKASKGDGPSIDRLLRIQERRAKLLGLDAPAKQELTGKDGDAIRIEAKESLMGRIAGLVERAAEARDSGQSQ